MTCGRGRWSDRGLASIVGSFPQGGLCGQMMSILGEMFHVERRQMLECRTEVTIGFELMYNFAQSSIFRPGRNGSL